MRQLLWPIGELARGSPASPAAACWVQTDAVAAGGRGTDSHSADLSPGLLVDKQAVPQHSSPAVLPAEAVSMTTEARQG